jgi:hypothetical protein
LNESTTWPKKYVIEPSVQLHTLSTQFPQIHQNRRPLFLRRSLYTSCPSLRITNILVHKLNGFVMTSSSPPGSLYLENNCRVRHFLGKSSSGSEGRGRTLHSIDLTSLSCSHYHRSELHPCEAHNGWPRRGDESQGAATAHQLHLQAPAATFDGANLAV